jgi:serine/threonine protein kinase
MNDLNLEISESIDSCLALILSRPDKKERKRRVVKALDDQVENWESVARNPEFKLWLLVENLTTKKRRYDLLRDAWFDNDGNTLSIIFRLFLDHVAGNRPQRYGDVLKGTNRKVGDLVERDYEIIDLLGVGGFGEVFLVYSHNENVKSFYALKILHAAVVDEDGIKRFETEARLLLSLDSSPYLVTARFIEKRDDQISLAMDYVQPDRNGRTTLQQHIKAGPVKLEDQIKWVVECCAGLATAYKAGIKAHRDIKPANILIDSSGRVRVSDFGLASLGLIPGNIKPSSLIAPRTNRDNSQTIEGTSFGTPAYMSPEQFSDASSCDVRSDIYSLGITMFEMASNGALPFLPRIDPNKVRVNLFAEFARLHVKAELPTINSPLFPAIAKCCAKSPSHRFQTIGELQSAVRDLASKYGLSDVQLVDSELSLMERYNRISNQAVAHARFGEHEKAIELYKQAIEIFDLGSATFDMGLSLQKLGKYQDALDAYMSIKTDRNADIECSIAYCQVKLGGWKRAIPHYLAATEFAPENINAWENLARGYADTAQRELAATAFDRLVGLPGVQASHWLEKGENEAELNRLSDSFNSLTAVIRRAGNGDEKIVDSARKILSVINKKGFFFQVKKLLGPGFNEARLKLATDAVFDAVNNGSADETRTIKMLRGAEPAITYSQAERIYKELIMPAK